MHIKLIVPTWEEESIRKMAGSFRWPPLNLPILAALTPRDIKVSIVDENVENIDWEDIPDLVGITCMTAQAPRAYSIASKYRKLGAQVVLGGIHPSMLPDEAIQYADAVVIGEAELLWPKVVQDFKSRNLQKFYKADKRPPMDSIPIPRRDLLKLDKYILFNSMQVFRGCPHNCTFCSVTKFFGNTYRARSIPDVIREMKMLKGTRLRSKVFAFIDDNIAGVPRYTKELCKAIIPLKIWWGSQASINVANDIELVKLLAKSGCRALFIGLESISQESLKEAHKSFIKISKFADAVKRLHDYGIIVEGAFVFGFDEDDESIFERTVKFADKIGIDVAQFTALTPFPGTRLWDKVEDRIITKDWSKYTIGNVVFKPQKMSVEKLQKGVDWAWSNFYSVRNVDRRILRALRRPGNVVPISILQHSYRKNIKQKKRYLKSLEESCGQE